MELHGRVIKGSGIGRENDLPPTMNLDLTSIPPYLEEGIYAVRVVTPRGRFDGVAHYGPRPAVKAGRSFEVHCFDLHDELYGEEVSVELVQRLREVRDFASIDELRLAIEADISEARKILGSTV